MVIKALNVAEKPSVAKEISRILSNGKYSTVCVLAASPPQTIQFKLMVLLYMQRKGFSQYNNIFEFMYDMNGQTCEMVVTSVTGHIMDVDFPAQYKAWSSCDPVALFDAPVVKSVKKVLLPFRHFSLPFICTLSLTV